MYLVQQELLEILWGLQGAWVLASKISYSCRFIKGMAQGTSSLLSNTVYALSDAATQFRKATHKGIVAFTFDDQAVGNMERQQKGISSHSKGVINEFFEGLTGLLQSPIKGAERHGLPGVLSGIALGVTGLVAKPAASILDITGKTAQSIRNRSKLHNLGSHRFRVRLPRHLNRELPLRPYSWEEAIGVSVLREAEDHIKLKDETLVVCKALRHDGKFVILTERLILIVSCSSIVKYRMPEFQGVPANPEWLVETEIGMDSVIHADNDDDEVDIVGSSSDALLRQNHISHKRSWGPKGKRWNNNPRTSLPQLQTNLVFTSKDEAEDFLQVLLSTIDKAKEQGRSSVHLLHQSSLRQL
ncbi:putative vacuolar protein sorting-associated protein 13A isoform X8 [Solanum tuberosum]|uniref:putative vacuolar protein sorting-associated protein 13A isoform X8 n=1 Tax=Solanum tuberosum TaxID=4113 RepID=UPI0003D29A53|nr:PREDICTED: putative vacuolar protein sorting-associated protein 13A isoform X8 [Solanum tuberosum]